MTPSDIIPAEAMVVVGQDALSRQALGALVEAEARRLVTTSFQLSKEESAGIDKVVGHPDTGYESRGDFLRHAVVELLTAWVRSGFPDTYIDDLVAHLREMRTASYMLRRRQEFSEILEVYEVSLEQTLAVGSVGDILDLLTVLRGYVERTPDAFWREHLRRTLAHSRNIQHAIGVLAEAAKTDKTLVKEAEVWTHWLDSLLS